MQATSRSIRPAWAVSPAGCPAAPRGRRRALAPEEPAMGVDDPPLGELAEPAKRVAMVKVGLGQRMHRLDAGLLEDVVDFDFASMRLRRSSWSMKASKGAAFGGQVIGAPATSRDSMCWARLARRPSFKLYRAGDQQRTSPLATDPVAPLFIRKQAAETARAGGQSIPHTRNTTPRIEARGTFNVDVLPIRRMYLSTNKSPTNWNIAVARSPQSFPRRRLSQSGTDAVRGSSNRWARFWIMMGFAGCGNCRAWGIRCRGIAEILCSGRSKSLERLRTHAGPAHHASPSPPRGSRKARRQKPGRLARGRRTPAAGRRGGPNSSRSDSRKSGGLVCTTEHPAIADQCGPSCRCPHRWRSTAISHGRRRSGGRSSSRRKKQPVARSLVADSRRSGAATTTVHYTNTEASLRYGRLYDWVAIFRDDKEAFGQWTVITAWARSAPRTPRGARPRAGVPRALRRDERRAATPSDRRLNCRRPACISKSEAGIAIPPNAILKRPIGRGAHRRGGRRGY